MGLFVKHRLVNSPILDCLGYLSHFRPEASFAFLNDSGPFFRLNILLYKIKYFRVYRVFKYRLNILLDLTYTYISKTRENT